MNRISNSLHNFAQKSGSRWVFLGIPVLTFLALVYWLWIWSHAVIVLYLASLVSALGVIYLIIDRFVLLKSEIKRLETQRSLVEKTASTANQRLEAVFRLSQKIVDASDEKDVVDLVLTISVELVGALGASFVPLDEHGQPLAAISHGNLPTPVFDAWVEYLASPSVRHQCSTCCRTDSITEVCPLLSAPFSEIEAVEKSSAIYCLPLKRGDREYGLLNFYLPAGYQFDEQTREFVRAMLDETALALEGVRLRRREMATFRQLQDVRQRTDLNGLLENFLENTRDTLKSDFAHLRVWNNQANPHSISLTAGLFPEKACDFLENLIAGQQNSPRPLAIGEVSGDSDSSPDIRSLLIVPLIPQEGVVLGTLLCGNLRSQSFSQRQLMLLQSLATQAALVVQNSQLLAALEYKTMMTERTRLAREIHDGLAQTLGLLKLQVAQMESCAEQGDWSRLEEILRSSNKILAEAYLDARHSIDGLRVGTSETGIRGWLEQTVEEFSENSGLPVNLDDVEIVHDLPPEIQAQLVRILQEALSNVRKHSGASQAWITCYRERGELVMEVRDDGKGFSPEDVPTASRYGLRGMRERSELIGAEFQIISVPQDGTTVRIRLPVALESQ